MVGCSKEELGAFPQFVVYKFIQIFSRDEQTSADLAGGQFFSPDCLSDCPHSARAIPRGFFDG
jgi:hypothetical protein